MVAAPGKLEEGDIVNFFSLIWRRRWFVLAATVASAVVGLAIGLALPKVYRGSMIIEVGKVYSFTKGDQQEKIELIEDPKNVENFFKSDGVLQALAKKTGIQKNIKALKDDFTIDSKSPPLVLVSFEQEDSKAILDGLTYLSEMLIAEHRDKFDVTVKSLAANSAAIQSKIKQNENKIAENENNKEQTLEKVQSNEEQIRFDRKQISTDVEYLKSLFEEKARSLTAMTELKARVSNLDPKTVTPLEILFLQNSIHNQEIHQSDIQREINDLKQRETERQKQIVDRQKAIADLHMLVNGFQSQNADLLSQIDDYRRSLASVDNFISASKNTRCRNAPMVLEKPVWPPKGLFTMVGGLIGMLVALIVALVRGMGQTSPPVNA